MKALAATLLGITLLSSADGGAQGPRVTAGADLAVLGQMLDGRDPAAAKEALERIGTPAARAALRRLAEGADGATLTEAARAALRRLEKRGM